MAHSKVNNLDHLRSQLANYNATALVGDFPNAAVLVPFREKTSGGLEILLTVRAGHMNSHAGEIAFPGGKEESEDSSLIHTALRESYEEIGLEIDNVEVIGQIDQMLSKGGIRVQPIVGIATQENPLIVNHDELDEIFSVPLTYFFENRPEIRKFNYHGNTWEMPEYMFGSYRIWGLTSMIIVNLLNIAYNMNLPQYIRPDFK